MDELNLVAKELFNKIRNRFSNLIIKDEKLQSTLDPETARFYYFDFEKDGRSLGHVNISLINNSLKVYYDKNIDKFLDPTDKKEWFDYLKSLRLFAKSNYPTIETFDVRDIDKSGLNIKDLVHIKSTDTTKNKNEVSESKRYGTSKSSYENLDDVRIITRHSKPIIDDTDPAATDTRKNPKEQCVAFQKLWKPSLSVIDFFLLSGSDLSVAIVLFSELFIKSDYYYDWDI